MRALFTYSSKTMSAIVGGFAAALTERGHTCVVAVDSADPDVLSSAKAFSRVLSTDLEDFKSSRPHAAFFAPAPPEVGWFDRVIQELFTVDTSSFEVHYKALLEDLARADGIVSRSRPDLLIVCEDGVSGNPFLVRAAQLRSVPVLIVPYEYSSRSAFERYLDLRSRTEGLPMAKGPAGRRIKRQCPQWIRKEGKFPGALMYPPDYILARERLGLTVKDAWSTHGGTAEALAVESGAMMKHYIAQGLPRAKLVLTGTPYADTLHGALNSHVSYRNAFDRADTIKPGEVSVLVSWPPNFHSTRGTLCDFPDYRSMTSAVISHLRTLKPAKLTFSLHPATTTDDRIALSRLGIVAEPQDVIDLIPRHDIYITCFSGTIRWAVASAKPVVNYDLYGFRLPDFDECPGVLTVNTMQSFQQVTKSLFEDHGRYQAIAAAQKTVSSRWAILDGRNTENLCSLAERMAGGERDFANMHFFRRAQQPSNWAEIALARNPD